MGTMNTTLARGGPVRLAILLLVAAAVLVACGSSAGASLSPVAAPIDGDAQGQQPGVQPAASMAPNEAGGGTGNTTGGNPPTDALRDDLKVVYTGSLSLVVADLQPALAQGRAAVLATGGYVGASEESNDGETAYATITYRIPAARWDDAITSLRGLATRVVGERTHATEVGGQLVDLEARIRNLRASEGVLVGIAEGTGSVTDLLEVEARIAGVRGQIEQLDAQRAQLEDQVAYGTLVATFGTEVEQVATVAKGWDPKTDVDGAVATLVEAGQALVSGGIWFGIVWLPVILILVVAGLAIRWALRRFFPGARPVDAIAGWGHPER
jgi:hypothetical protein